MGIRVICSGKLNGRGHHAGAKGSQNPIKKLAHWVELLGQLLSQKNVF